MFSVVTKYHKGRHSLFLYNSEIFYAFTQDILRSLFFIKVFKRLFQQANRLENQVDVRGYQHNGGKPSSVLDPSMIGELTHQLLVTGEHDQWDDGKR